MRMDTIISGSSGHPGESEDVLGTDQWASGYSAALQSFDDAPNSQVSCPPTNGQPSQGFSIDNNHGSQDPPSLKSEGCKEEKRVQERICIHQRGELGGVNQTSGGYYKRMHDYFNEHKPAGSNRSQIAVQHRWALIQKAMNKFCVYKEAIDRQNESGKNEQNRINDAIQMYEKNGPFTIMHCWKKLCKEAKWNNKFLELNNSTSLDGMSSPPTQGHTVAGHAESGNENIDTSPRDSAKRRRSKNFTETSSSSMAVEVLQQLQEKSEKTEQKQDQQMAEILSRKDEKIKIQRDLFNLQKKHMKMIVQQKKKENAFREESEAQLITAESSIMTIDIEKNPSMLKNYYLGMQRQIMERRGFVSPSNNED